MASPSHEAPHASPTGLVIHEPSFPDIAGHPAGPAQAAVELNLSPVDEDHSRRLSTTAHDTPEQHTSTTKTEAPNSRPPRQRSATERPKASTKHSVLDRIHSRSQGNRLHRPTAVKFAAESSESEADSSDDELSPEKSLSHGSTLANQRPQKQRTSTFNPSSEFKLSNDHFKSSGRISESDGRLKLRLREKDADSGYLAKALGAVLTKHSPNDSAEGKSTYDKRDIEVQKIAPEDDEMEHDPARRVKLNIVIIIIGSRGDIQPFIRIGKILQDDYGHRVRMATHPAFKDFVEKDSGLEFFSIGGNPAELMAFMVKNPGLMPGLDTIKEGEIGRRRAQMYEMFGGMWRACINATDDETDETNVKMMGDKAPFIADAIIANPPSFAPPHIAEKLGIPLHMMFTFPYTPTVHFPHPLANIKMSNVEATYGNFMSYPLVEMMTWQGLGDLINRFRTTILRLEQVSTLWAPGQLYRLKVPYTYMWSPSLIQKPKDWGPEIDVTGFVFLDLASSFKPPDDLQKFLDSGDPPVYIGFGSIVVDDPDAFTQLIFEAVKLAGCRALVSKGWGGFGSNADCPDNIFMLENTPHDWLFPHCSAVVHHGGAGTTAIGLKTARPTMIVPFFGDQPFWGAMVSKAKAGAHECIPYKKLTAERLAEGIKQCLTEEARQNVKKIADSIEKEGDGALNAVRSFHRSLPLRGAGSMRCDFLDNRAAAWKIKNTDVKLSALAAEILVEKKKLNWNELRLVRHYEWNDFGGPGEPITGVWSSFMSTFTDAAAGVGGVPVHMGKSIKRREKIREKKRAIHKRMKHQKSVLANVKETSHDPTLHNSDPKAEGTNPSRPSANRQESLISTISEPDEYLADELAHEASTGVRKTSHAIARLPMNISLALTQGFHNAPRLYGDETVRRPPRVTGFHSGLRAGREELIYGIKDGVTGLVTQPIRMAKQKGIIGAATGVGYGIGGFVLKDIAAFLGPGAYFLKGLDAEYMKRYQPTNYLRRARIAQGQLELQLLVSDKGLGRTGKHADSRERKVAERKDIVEQAVSERWLAFQSSMEKDKKLRKSGVVASLLGTVDKKDGQRVPRKSEDEHREPRPNKAKTTHLVDEGPETHKKGKENMDHSRSKPSLKDHGPGLNRSSTAPIIMLERKQGDGRRPLDRSQAAGGAKPESQGPGHLQDQQATGQQTLPSVQEGKNRSDPDIADTNDQSSDIDDFETPLASPALLAGKDGGLTTPPRQPSIDAASSADTRVETETDAVKGVDKIEGNERKAGGNTIAEVRV